MDRLKKPEAVAEQSPVEATGTGEVKFTSYLDVDLNRRLQIHVATKKAQKRPGQERVSIKSELHQALEEYLERHRQ
ncbi:hypothetical protein HNQ07_004246 [Deinococcus metalli]|uniref:Uncharacterized protein n=1 Tax=Deinococcus metalli TaxID=1141878 RepID=A0A7W8NQ72_9DEIO|nr:hypothetical protein [Deinococcus metalli]MBB5378739.1 hypothetical protein [Deinococcus metalli]GHF60313.1 hypothetical protein GCM10017781_40600 [Deinococcus metalli]